MRCQLIEGAGVAHLICDYVKSEGIDIVVMSTHGVGITDLLFGSTTNCIMHGVKVPVLLVQPGKS